MFNLVLLFKSIANHFGYVLITQKEYKGKLNVEFAKGYQERILDEQTKQ